MCLGFASTEMILTIDFSVYSGEISIIPKPECFRLFRAFWGDSLQHTQSMLWAVCHMLSSHWWGHGRCVEALGLIDSVFSDKFPPCIFKNPRHKHLEEWGSWGLKGVL